MGFVVAVDGPAGSGKGTITKIEDNGQNARAIFEYDVDGHHYTQKTQWTSALP